MVYGYLGIIELKNVLVDPISPFIVMQVQHHVHLLHHIILFHH
jgi:hypothetical protein